MIRHNNHYNLWIALFFLPSKLQNYHPEFAFLRGVDETILGTVAKKMSTNVECAPDREGKLRVVEETRVWSDRGVKVSETVQGTVYSN